MKSRGCHCSRSIPMDETVYSCVVCLLTFMRARSIGNRAGRKARSTYEEDELRKPRKFCDGGGVFCTLYRAIQGEGIGSHQMAERREELNAPRYGTQSQTNKRPATLVVWWAKSIVHLISSLFAQFRIATTDRRPRARPKWSTPRRFLPRTTRARGGMWSRYRTRAISRKRWR